MKTIGIIAEYNPFHNGHKHHIEKTRKITGCENIVVVMSGNYVQRGEPAIVDKWTRTKAALLGGADIVIELPTLFSSSTAETFAFSAVKLLDDSSIVDGISFGSESGNISDLKEVAMTLLNETNEYKEKIKAELDKGISYPLARQKAFELSNNNKDILAQSNNILAVEYLKALHVLKSKIIPFTITRQGENYNSLSLNSEFSSATALRKNIIETKKEIENLAIPDFSRHLLNNAISDGKCPICFNDFSRELIFSIRTKTKEELSEILDISEGLENRILNAVQTQSEITEILKAIKTKRYTYTRLQRALLHILLDIKRKDMKKYKDSGYSPYIRVLGFKKEKQQLLSEMTKKSKIPVIINFKDVNLLTDKKIKNLLQLELKYTNIYSSASPSKNQRTLNQEYTNSVVII